MLTRAELGGDRAPRSQSQAVLQALGTLVIGAVQFSSRGTWCHIKLPSQKSLLFFPEETRECFCVCGSGWGALRRESADIGLDPGWRER